MTIPAVADFETEVREWFSEHGRTLLAQLSSSRWGEGSDDVSVFDDVSDDEQAKRLADGSVRRGPRLAIELSTSIQRDRGRIRRPVRRRAFGRFGRLDRPDD